MTSQEDAATAEVSRTQLWQWAHHNVSTIDGVRLDKKTVLDLLNKQAQELVISAPEGHKFDLAIQYSREQIIGEDYAGFLTQ